VTEVARYDPVVLVPTHRSYFDFLIVSSLFYRRHMLPPHIAARENMAFGPFGFLWRRAGAFFLRRSFADPLYKEVFRTYVAYLIKEGFTQEFFIEGGRSRTGKTLPPRLGVLAWDVEAFLASGRRDLLFVPVALTYERLVEEGAMVGELEGAAKEDESMLRLMRAWRFLQRRFGSVFVNFGAPLSLAEAIGDRREEITGESDEATAARRAFVEQLGQQIVEQMNLAVVPHATSVAACALLGERRRGLFRARPRAAHAAARRSAADDEREAHPRAAARRGRLLRLDRVAPAHGPDPRRAGPARRDPVLRAGKRRALDIYRNSILHYLAAPSFLALELLARRLARGGARAAVRLARCVSAASSSARAARSSPRTWRRSCPISRRSAGSSAAPARCAPPSSVRRISRSSPSRCARCSRATTWRCRRWRSRASRSRAERSRSGSPSSTSARRCSARSSCPRRTTRSRSATRSTC
jgi:glycerol-3-phosphate O-acyltransferase